MADHATLTFTVDQGVGWIRLARPEKRNPFDSELRAELMQVLEQVREDPTIRVLVLAGSPGAFCAGGNLPMLHDHLDAGATYWQQRLTTGQRLIHDLMHLTRPLIAVVDGPAYGAGFSLALTADIVLASPRARFAMSYLRLGLVPDMAPMYLLPRMIGMQRAKELIFSTREIDADEAKSLGLVMEVQATSERLEARAAAIAASLTATAPAAMAMTKAAMNTSLDSDLSTMFTLESASVAAAFAAPEPRTAIEAMLAKRPPPYTGFPKTTPADDPSS